MSYFDFNPFGTESIVVSFECDACNKNVESEEIVVPEPNYSAEKSKDSQTENEGYAVCGNCDKQFDIDIYVTYSGANGQVENLSEDTQVYIQENVELDDSELIWEIESSAQLDIFNNHINSIENLLSIPLDEQTQFSLLVMLHAHIISSIELFLSSTFIHEVISSDVLTKKLIETDPEFGNRKFTLKEIYHENKKLNITVAIYLKSLIFHDLKKIKPMYLSVLNYDFGDISWLFKAITLRHDCAHRAGYTKDSEKINITINSIKELIIKCKLLTKEINSHIATSD